MSQPSDVAPNGVTQHVDTKPELHEGVRTIFTNMSRTHSVINNQYFYAFIINNFISKVIII